MELQDVKLQNMILLFCKENNKKEKRTQVFRDKWKLLVSKYQKVINDTCVRNLFVLCGCET